MAVVKKQKGSVAAVPTKTEDGWSEEEMDDEVDVAGVSSDEEGEGDDENAASDSDGASDAASGSESESDSFPTSLKSKSKGDGSSAFASALGAIVGSKLKAYDRKDPVLARSKKTIQNFENEKLEAKAKRALAAERKVDMEKGRVRQLLPQDAAGASAALLRERQLKKVAQRGVVKLFNAVLSTQTQTAQGMEHELARGLAKREELMNEMSKEKFLDLVQAAGKS